MINWYFGWGMILSAFISGAIIGLFFHNEKFLGGYSAFPRRILRLGHIALAALGMINILFALSPITSEPAWRVMLASYGLIIGGITMPLVCFLSAWHASFRHLFFIPVTALITASLQAFWIGPP